MDVQNSAASQQIEPFSNVPGFTLLGWPKETSCTRCGAKAAHLSSTISNASYECRGTPTDDSAYGPDACYFVFVVYSERT